jgi:hypothetical protein
LVELFGLLLAVRFALHEITEETALEFGSGKLTELVSFLNEVSFFDH